MDIGHAYCPFIYCIGNIVASSHESRVSHLLSVLTLSFHSMDLTEPSEHLVKYMKVAAQLVDPGVSFDGDVTAAHTRLLQAKQIDLQTRNRKKS